MAATPPLASAKGTQVLDSIVAVLRLAKAGVTGIWIPAVEPMVNGVYELAQMISVGTLCLDAGLDENSVFQTMKSNKEGLAALEKSLTNLAAIDISGADGDLKDRLEAISSQV
jgi:hypothetical protein